LACRRCVVKLNKGANEIKYKVLEVGKYSLSGERTLPLRKPKLPQLFGAIVIQLKFNFQTVTSKWQIWNIQGACLLKSLK
jgi:hypothetical protein